MAAARSSTDTRLVCSAIRRGRGAVRLAPDILERNRARRQERVVGEHRQDCEGVEKELAREATNYCAPLITVTLLLPAT